jgi:hypothetical protein
MAGSGHAATSGSPSTMTEVTITLPPQITLEEIETLPGLSPESRECIRRLYNYKPPQFDLSVSHIEFRHN